MRTLLSLLILASCLVPAAAQAAAAQASTWSGVDWRSVSADRVKLILAAKGKTALESFKLSPADDPDRRLPPDAATPFLLAICYSSDQAVIQAFLASGARADDRGGQSPLMYAAEYNPNPEVIDELIAAGADVRANLGYRFLARPALTYAAQYNPNPAVSAELIKKGAAVNAKVSVLDNMGTAPLMYAAQYNKNPAVVEELIKDGAAVDLPDSMGRTSLVFAAEYNPNSAVLAALLAAGARPNVVGRDYYNVGFTPLMYAAISEYGQLEQIGLLLDAGADPKAKSREEKTALDYARANGAIAKGSAVFKRLEAATR